MSASVLDSLSRVDMSSALIVSLGAGGTSSGPCVRRIFQDFSSASAGTGK